MFLLSSESCPSLKAQVGSNSSPHICDFNLSQVSISESNHVNHISMFCQEEFLKDKNIACCSSAKDLKRQLFQNTRD